MSSGGQRVCGMEHAGMLDNRIRSLFQNPYRILSPYVSSGFTCLDLGCGPGFFSLPMAELVGASGRVIAADLQEGMLRLLETKIQGTELAKRIILHRCEEDRIGIKDNLDFVLAFYMLHELPDPVGSLTEIQRMLNPQGKVLIVEPNVHVSGKAFAGLMNDLQRTKFAIVERPGVFMSRAVVLTKCG